MSDRIEIAMMLNGTDVHRFKFTSQVLTDDKSVSSIKAELLATIDFLSSYYKQNKND